MSFEIPKDYPLVMGVALAMSWQMFAQGMSVGPFRKKIFNKEFMEKQFGQLHTNDVKEPIKAGGYPDTGNGVYSKKLSYRDWYHFNVLQRIHLNYVEGITLAQLSVLSSGLYEPKLAAKLGVLYIVGRGMYSFFYKKKGGAFNKGRMVGMMLATLTCLINTGIFLTKLYKQYKS